MKREKGTLRTKQAMAESLKKLMQKKTPDEDELVQNVSVLILSLPDMLKKAEAYCR